MTASVVCGVDHSARAHTVATFAAELADRLEARLILLHAVDVSVPTLAPAWPVHLPSDQPDLRNAAREAGDRFLADLIRETGIIGASTRVEDGPPTNCLVRVGDEEDAAFIVVGTAADGAVRTVGVGSVSLALGRHASRPLVVVPPGVSDPRLASPDVDAVVCGLAGPEDLEPLRTAVRLARDLDLPLVAAHVIPAEDEHTSARNVAGIRTLITRVPEARTARAQSDLRARLESAGAWPGALDGPAILVGEPAEQLADLAAATRAGLVVVGTRGRGPIRSALLGSVSRSLATASVAPVVICPER
jgi:nucleotide-binding universal stress UspA family protein